MSRPVSDALVKQAVAALKRNFGNITHAARDLGIPKGTLENRLERARNRGIWEDPPDPPIPEPVKPFSAENVPPPSYTGGHAIEVLSSKDNTARRNAKEQQGTTAKTSEHAAQSATFIVVDGRPAISASTTTGHMFLHLSDATVALLFEQMAQHYARTISTIARSRNRMAQHD